MRTAPAAGGTVVRTWVLTLGIVLVAAACSPSPGDIDAGVDAGADAGCPGTPPTCCSGGCNGSAVPALCLPSHKWICPPDSVPSDDCADAGVRSCSG